MFEVENEARKLGLFINLILGLITYVSNQMHIEFFFFNLKGTAMADQVLDLIEICFWLL